MKFKARRGQRSQIGTRRHSKWARTNWAKPRDTEAITPDRGLEQEGRDSDPM